MSDQRRGLVFGATAYLLWGLFPLYFPLLEPASSGEILAHRIVWSLAVVGAVLLARRRWGWVRELGRDRAASLRLLAAAVLIAGNWLLYIYGVTTGHVVETALGYFTNPLVSVLLGVFVLGERMRRLQWAAVATGTLAVVLLTVDYGRPPWIALGLACSFGTYGLLKKQVGTRVAALEGLAVETALLVVPALCFIGWLAASGDGVFGTAGNLDTTALLLSSGVVTAIPLLLFAGAARRIPLTWLGLLQYLAPVLQFLTGVLVYREPMPPSRLAGFALVWLALVVLTVDGLRHSRNSRPLPAAIMRV